MEERNTTSKASITNKEPLISVIIPTYNMEKYITDAIDSALAQTYKNVEIIVVDDGSTDFTINILKKYNSKIKYFYQKNKGPSAARNVGIKYAKGEYIAFLDSDDVWLPRKLELQVKYFSENAFRGLIYTGYYTIDETGETVEIHKIEDFSKNKVLKDLFFKNVISTASTIMVNRECFEESGGFDENLAVAEDWDMWLRIIKRYDFDYISEPLVKVKFRKGSQSYYGDKNLNNEIRFLDKLFSDPWLRKKILLKRKAYSYRYFSAAWAFCLAGNTKKARFYILKSICIFPFKLFPDKYWRYGLFFKVFFGTRITGLLKKFIAAKEMLR